MNKRNEMKSGTSAKLTPPMMKALIAVVDRDTRASIESRTAHALAKRDLISITRHGLVATPKGFKTADEIKHKSEREE